MISHVRRSVGCTFLAASLLGIGGAWTSAASAATPHGVPMVSATTMTFDQSGSTMAAAYSASLALASGYGYTASECTAPIYQLINRNPIRWAAEITCTN